VRKIWEQGELATSTCLDEELRLARHWCQAGSPSPGRWPRIGLRLTSVKQQATVYQVRLRNFAHKGLHKLYAEDSAKGVPPDSADKLRKMLAFLDNMQEPEELRALATWKAHTLSGDRKGTWSLSVTRNHRLTFRIDTKEQEICDINLEDYH
jgi:proteic killer suppression protein